MRSAIGLGVLAALLLVVPGSVEPVFGADDPSIMRFATLAPRSPLAEAQAKKWGKRVSDATGGKLKIQVFFGGVAGEDQAVLHKMKMGQLDASAVQANSLASYVRQAQLLVLPGLYFNYRQLDAVIKDVGPDFDAEAYQNGLKVLGWGDIGMLRLFSRTPVKNLTELRRMRLWLWSEAPLMKDFYTLLGVVGVPMGIVEVFAGLQTRMIDVVYSSALGAVALQWTNSTPYISKQGAGYITGAMVISRRKFDAFPPDVAKALVDLSVTYHDEVVNQLRQADDMAYKALLKHGLKVVPMEDEQQWMGVFKQLRERFVGRLYSREMLTRVEKICEENK
jgi:TRAP-type transport system periplasmic protein